MSVLFNSFVPVVGSVEWPKFSWDDWNFTDYFYYFDEGVVAGFSALNGYSCRAYCLGVAELIAARMSPLTDVSDLVEYFDAAWTTMGGTDSCDYGEIFQELWRGPIRGPVRAAALVANDTLFEAMEDGFFDQRCAWAMQLSRHVLEGKELAYFESWSAFAVQKLKQASETNMDDSLGPPISPDFLILNGPSTLSSVPRELDQHRARITDDNQWFGDFHYLN